VYVRAKTNANAAYYLEPGIDVDSDGVPIRDVEREVAVRSDGDGRSGAFPTVLDTVDHITVLASRKARLETRVPILIRVVDRHEPSLATSERNELRTRREPVRHFVRLNGVPESDHSGDGGPTVLTVPSVGSAVSTASAVVPVGGPLIGVTELVTG